MTEYLIVGNGVAGTTAAEHIRKNDGDGPITIITDEVLPFYWRIQLNELIAGEKTEQDLVVKDEAWYQGQQIHLELNTRITGGDPGRKTLESERGRTYAYDKLLLATGSRSFVPPIKGSDKAGVFTLRNVADVRDIKAHAGKSDNAVLIGGGLLGLETGHAFAKLAKQVKVVEFFPRLLPRQLDDEGASRLQALLEDMGFEFRLGAKTREIFGGDSVEGVMLEGGESLDTGMVIVSAGVRPDLELPNALGLETDKGVKVNERLQAGRPEIFAAGDLVEWKGMPYGIWPAAMEQGKIAGTNMAGGDLTYEGTTMANTLKVVGIDLASAGEIDVEGEHDSRSLHTDRVYKKVVFEDNRIIGCIMLGDTKGFNRIARAMKEKEDISGKMDLVIFDWAS